MLILVLAREINCVPKVRSRPKTSKNVDVVLLLAVAFSVQRQRTSRLMLEKSKMLSSLLSLAVNESFRKLSKTPFKQSPRSAKSLSRRR